MALRSAIVIDFVLGTKTYVVTIEEDSWMVHQLKNVGWSCICQYNEGHTILQVLKKVVRMDEGIGGTGDKA